MTLQFKKIEAGLYKATDSAGNDIEVAKYKNGAWGWTIWCNDKVAAGYDFANVGVITTKKECIKDAQESHEVIGDELFFCRFVAEIEN